MEEGLSIQSFQKPKYTPLTLLMTSFSEIIQHLTYTNVGFVYFGYNRLSK